MGVDFYTCTQCKEISGDCGGHKTCGCGAWFCESCVNASREKGVPLTFRDPASDDDDDDEDDECIACTEDVKRRKIVTDEDLLYWLLLARYKQGGRVGRAAAVKEFLAQL